MGVIRICHNCKHFSDRSNYCDDCVGKSDAPKFEPIDSEVIILRSRCAIKNEEFKRWEKIFLKQKEKGLIFLPSNFEYVAGVDPNCNILVEQHGISANMKCAYCEEGKALVIGKTNDQGIAIQHPNILNAYGYDVHGSGSNGLVTRINYCPMCGRKLKVE